MARNGARSPLQKNPTPRCSDKDSSPSFPSASSSSSSSSSSASTSACRRSWKLSGSAARTGTSGGGEEVPHSGEASSRNNSSRHLLVLLRRHSSIFRHRPFTRRDVQSCCFCCFCCCTCTCLPATTSILRVRDDSTAMGSGDVKAEPKPSLEEIRSWGESFDRLMRCAAGRQLFREFLQREYSEENILFWSACEDLKRERNPELVQEKARLIYDDYVSVYSPREVSLDSKVREIVETRMEQPTANTFDEAQLQIYTLMHRDSYPRFLGSSVYRQFAELSPTSREASVSVH